jgi:hypothetical protein
VPLELPYALLVEQAGNLDLDAYEEVMDSVSLSRRRITPSELGNIRNAPSGLILAVPGAAARSLSAQQIQNVVDAVESGAILITEQITPLSRALGFQEGKVVTVREAEELAYPEVSIRWPHPATLTSPILPGGAMVLNRERPGGYPLAALSSHGKGRCLFLAAPLDPDSGGSYRRFPYLLQELKGAGVVYPFRSERLAALFDYAYRLKADLPTLVSSWRRAGITSLHVGAWDFFDLNGDKKRYLNTLIEQCHKNGILVYAWLEWPHVSDSFWRRHPQWREKTATGRDAKVDWRLLMDLENPECFRAATGALRDLLLKFDWDGVDIAELYFESPDGLKAPEDFTPLNRQVRRDFQSRFGIDPLELFRKDSRYYWESNPAGWAKFVDYRVQLERNLNLRLLQFLSDLRRAAKPSLALIVLYVDNIYDPTMREAVGADLKVMLPLLAQYDFTLVMEDPSTVWHLGPRRYAELAHSYAQLTPRTDRLGIDINIVDRAQEVSPTEKQTGSEFLQLFHFASMHFATVMVYSEQSMYPQDLELVSHALASEASAEIIPQGARIRSERPVLFRMQTRGEILVDGNPWPCVASDGVLLPKGTHEVALVIGSASARPRLVRFNGTLLDARYIGEGGIACSYESGTGAIALFDRPIRSLELDDGPFSSPGPDWVMLPAGAHRIRALF